MASEELNRLVTSPLPPPNPPVTSSSYVFSFVVFIMLRELYKNNIEGTIPSELGNLKDLISLDLYNNNLTGKIPTSLEKLKSLVFLKATQDVEIKAGWTVLVFLMVVHFDPDVYKNPLEFNPWRWEGKDVRSASKTFVAFGGGMRQCVGSE